VDNLHDIKRLMDLGCYRGLRHAVGCRCAASAPYQGPPPAKARPRRSPARISRPVPRKHAIRYGAIRPWPATQPNVDLGRSEMGPADGSASFGAGPRKESRRQEATRVRKRNARTIASGSRHVKCLRSNIYDITINEVLRATRSPGRVGARWVSGLAQSTPMRRRLPPPRRGRPAEGAGARHATLEVRWRDRASGPNRAAIVTESRGAAHPHFDPGYVTPLRTTAAVPARAPRMTRRHSHPAGQRRVRAAESSHWRSGMRETGAQLNAMGDT